MPTTKKTTKTKKVKNDSFFDKAGNALKTIWSYISTGRDYFWKGVRFTLATGIFLFVVISIVSSAISPLWQTSDEIDPQGKVVLHTLQNMGMKTLSNIRQGKYFEIEIEETNQEIVKKDVDSMCKKLLANLIIEDYKIDII